MKEFIAFIVRLLSGGKPSAPPKPPLPAGMLSPHFSADEFRCKCCGELHPSGVMPPRELLEILEDTRAHFGAPVSITSGYRCPRHNAAVGGAKASRHMEGDAADIKVKGVSPAKVHAYLDRRVGDRGGVGRYNSFTHVDVRGYKSRW